MDDLVPHLARSRDAGKTWQLSINIGPAACDRPVLGVSPSGRYVVVAASMSETTDAYSGKPFDSRDPRLEEKIAAANRFYSGIFVSSDYGANWQQYEGPMDGKNAIPFAVVIDDSGSIASSWVVEGDGSSSVVCISTDEGQTWSQTTLVDSLQPDRSHPFNGERFPVLTVDGNSGLHVAYVTAQAESLVVRSSDDWKSWQEPIKLSGDEAEEVRMAAIDAYGALVHVTWMERSGEVWHAYYCGSHDHGRTWANPVCLSGGMGRLPTPANGFQLFGDDDQSSVRDDGQGRVHAVWAIRGGQIMHAVLDWKKTATARVQ